MEELLRYLRTIEPGPLTDTADLETLLARCWHEFDGSGEEGMAAYKLHGRLENAVWSPPELSFTIERHGGTVQGSTRAERHQWTLDLEATTAGCGRIGYRQVRPAARRLDVRPLAEEIVRLILERQPDARLKWNDSGSVRIHIGKILPEGSVVKETLAGRRKRFRQAVDGLLAGAGWERIQPNVYWPPTPF